MGVYVCHGHTTRLHFYEKCRDKRRPIQFSWISKNIIYGNWKWVVHFSISVLMGSAVTRTTGTNQCNVECWRAREREREGVTSYFIILPFLCRLPFLFTFVPVLNSNDSSLRRKREMMVTCLSRIGYRPALTHAPYFAIPISIAISNDEKKQKKNVRDWSQGLSKVSVGRSTYFPPFFYHSLFPSFFIHTTSFITCQFPFPSKWIQHKWKFKRAKDKRGKETEKINNVHMSHWLQKEMQGENILFAKAGQEKRELEWYNKAVAQANISVAFSSRLWVYCSVKERRIKNFLLNSDSVSLYMYFLCSLHGCSHHIGTVGWCYNINRDRHNVHIFNTFTVLSCGIVPQQQRSSINTIQ